MVRGVAAMPSDPSDGEPRSDVATNWPQFDCPECGNAVWISGLDDATTVPGEGDHRQVVHCGVCELAVVRRMRGEPGAEDHPSLDEEVAIASYTARESYHLVDPEAAEDADDRTLCGNVESSSTLTLDNALRCTNIDDPEDDLCAVCASMSDDIDKEWTDISNRNDELKTTTCPNCGEDDIKFSHLGTHVENDCPAAPDPPDSTDDDPPEQRRWVG